MKSLRVRVWWLELGPLQTGGSTILRPGGFKGRKTRDLVLITLCDGDSNKQHGYFFTKRLERTGEI
jgi:hypothetical protein